MTGQPQVRPLVDGVLAEAYVRGTGHVSRKKATQQHRSPALSPESSLGAMRTTLDPSKGTASVT